VLIGIVSDTHGHVEFTRPAVRLLESCGVERVIHCGDIGAEEIVPLFARWPTHFVFGNVDSAQARLTRAIEAAGQTCHGRFGTIELGGRKIAFLHGDDDALLNETISCEEYDLVCHGHTHVAVQRRVGNTLVVNPGALYRAQPHSLAVVRLPELEIAHLAL